MKHWRHLTKPLSPLNITFFEKIKLKFQGFFENVSDCKIFNCRFSDSDHSNEPKLILKMAEIK